MAEKCILVGSFVRKERILSYLEKVKNTCGVPYERVFVYYIGGNDDEYLVTFKSFHGDRWNKRINRTVVMHVKNGCIFSINGLNSLLRETGSENDGEVDWASYSGKLITANDGKLSINDIKKIEDKCVFLN